MFPFCPSESTGGSLRCVRYHDKTHKGLTWLQVLDIRNDTDQNTIWECSGENQSIKPWVMKCCYGDSNPSRGRERPA